MSLKGLELESGRVLPATDIADALALPSPDLVEKDFHVVHALKAVIAVKDDNYRLVFAGGTALARAHRLIRRMSEDIGLKVVPIGDEDRRSARKVLRSALERALKGVPFKLANKTVRNEGRYFRFNLDYPRSETTSGILRPQILVEFTQSPLRRDSVDLPISSFAAEAAQEPPEITSIACCSTSETAAEKIVSLTRRIACDLENPCRIEFDRALIRHLYDLHSLQGHFDEIDTCAMATETAESDAEQFAAQYPAYKDNPEKQTQKALGVLESEKRFRDQYDDFVGKMVYGNKPSYDDALKVLRRLVEQMWPSG